MKLFLYKKIYILGKYVVCMYVCIYVFYMYFMCRLLNIS